MNKFQLIRLMPQIRAAVERAGFRPFQGDCANFAVALGNAVGATGTKKYVASYEDVFYVRDGEPSHVALVWQGSYWDASGITNRPELFRIARYLNDQETAYGAKVYRVDEEGFAEIFGDERSKIIESIIRSVILGN